MPTPVEQAAPPAPTRAKNSLVGSGSGYTESVRGLICGVVYGTVSPLIGHPLDTIKTIMQASPERAKGGAITTAREIMRQGGLHALYRGLLPPLVGSSIFRSVQFSVYGAAYGGQRGTVGEAVIPGTGGLQLRVLTAGVCASLVRSLLESPLEFIKVRQQTSQQVTAAGGLSAAMAHPLTEFRRLFTGFGAVFMRTWGLMGLFFCFVDHLERHHAPLLAQPGLGPFIKGGVCATAAWIIVWPFEVIKNQIQAGMAGVATDASFMTRVKWVIANRGVVGLYRGIGPGVTRSMVANGSSMLAYSKCKELLFDV